MNRILWFLLLFLATACAVDPIVAPSPTPSPVATLGSLPTLPPLSVSMYSPPLETILPVMLPVTEPEPPLPAKPCEEVEPFATRYDLEGTLDWDDHRIEVIEQVTFYNSTNTPLEALVFQVEPNRIGDFFTLNHAKTVDDRTIEGITLEKSRLVVPLPAGVGTECSVSILLSFTLSIPPVISGYEGGRIGYFGYTDRQLNLGHWMPVLALYKEAWYTPEDSLVGEQTITESSDFTLKLEVLDAPQTIVMAAPGVVQLVGANTWETKLESARDLTISIGNGLRRVSQIADNGTIVEVFYFPETEPEGLKASDQALASASEAIALYADLFGVEYPYSRMVVVQGDFPDGMEFSGLVFVSEAWFRTWRGTPNEWLTVITVHEVAHQWWYSLIGNDPANYPYLDEAFATYSEYLYFEHYYADKTQWWWDFRVSPYTLTGPVDATIYLYGSDTRAYINAVYLRGAQMLHSMRRQLGDEAFFDWLMSYAAESQFKVVTPVQLWGELPPEQYAASEEIRQRYFDQWGILPATPTSGG